MLLLKRTKDEKGTLFQVPEKDQRHDQIFL